jgi:ABC-type branched-subunit amino acid transport system ATPase component
VLRERGGQLAGNLSGGEQQMLGLGMAFIAKPRLLMIDELTLGLAPTIVSSLIDIVRAIHAQGTTIILVEQSVNVALTLAHRAVFMEKGEVRFSGPTADLLERDDILRSVFLEGAAAHPGSANGAKAATARGARPGQAIGPVAGNGAKPRTVPRPADAVVLLELDGVAKHFGGIVAVDGVSFELREGEILGLIGPNGAGKTTLFNVVSGLVPPDAGSIRFDGQDIAAWSPDTVSRRGLVRTFQVARGFPKLSVFQHLMLYGRDQPGESLWQAIVGTRAARTREAELAERAWATARFLRLDHLIDNPATALSGGQKKLLEIGRALMAEPRLVLLDEPTAGVNPTLQNEIGERLLELPRRGITVLLIEHDMGFIARLCDPVIVMAEGQVLTQGTFDQVRADHRVREAYLGRRAA